MMTRCSILIIRPGALGDTILTLPVVESVRRLVPTADITWLGSRAYVSLVPPGINFEAIDDPRWLWLFSPPAGNIPADGSRRFDAACVILNRPDDVTGNLQRCGTKRIVRVSSTPQPDKHMVEHLHAGLGLTLPPRKPALAHLAADRRDELMWVHPGSGGPKKCIPLAAMAKLVRKIQEMTAWNVAITAGEEDGFLKDDPAWKAIVSGRDTKLLDCRPLPEVCRELAGARLFVGNDCGISHLAAGLGIPSAVFFSTTSPVQWAPWTKNDLLVTSQWSAGDFEAQMQGILRWVQR